MTRSDLGYILTEDFFCVFMLAVGAKDLACDGLAGLFRHSRRRRNPFARSMPFFEDRLILGFGSGSQCEKQSSRWWTRFMFGPFEQLVGASQVEGSEIWAARSSPLEDKGEGGRVKNIRLLSN